MLPPACPTASSLSKVAARQQTAAPVAACFGRNTGLRHCQCLAALPRRAGGSQPQSTSTTTLEPERGLATEVLQNLHSSLDGDNESSLSEDLCSLKLASQKQHMLNKLLNGQNPEGSRRSGSNTIGSSDIQGVSRVYMAAATVSFSDAAVVLAQNQTRSLCIWQRLCCRMQGYLVVCAFNCVRFLGFL